MGCVSCTKEKKNYNTHTMQKFNNNTCRKCLIPCESLFVCAMWWRFVVSAKPNRSIFSLAVFLFILRWTNLIPLSRSLFVLAFWKRKLHSHFICDEFENRIRFAMLQIDTSAGFKIRRKKKKQKKSAFEHAHNMGWS